MKVRNIVDKMNNLSNRIVVKKGDEVLLSTSVTNASFSEFMEMTVNSIQVVSDTLIIYVK